MNIILCGSNWIGCRALDHIGKIAANIFVYTHEEEYYIPSLSQYCTTRGVACTTEKISIKNLPFRPDLLISMYYKYIIPPEVLSQVEVGAFNCHPSLLPAYRGCSSITWAMINGEEYAGFSYHYMTPRVDQGKIIVQHKVELFPYENQINAYQRIMFAAADHFIEALNRVIERHEGYDQLGNSSWNRRGAPFSGIIDENWSDDKVKRFIRAMISPPLPLAKFKGISISSFEDYKNLRGYD